MLCEELGGTLGAGQGEPALGEEEEKEVESGSAQQLVTNRSETAPRTFLYAHPSSAASGS